MTREIDALRAAYDPLANGPERYELHAKCSALVSRRRGRFEALSGI